MPYHRPLPTFLYILACVVATTVANVITSLSIILWNGTIIVIDENGFIVLVCLNFGGLHSFGELLKIEYFLI